ncbi:MAG: hypothetical protein LUD68_00220, partial [Rikenellaceae bacterium]|nr:hypothetical protein [Rikenellaceae bacterium]
MKRKYGYIFPALALLGLCACSEETSIRENSEPVELETVELYMAGRDTETRAATRAVSDFAVNSANDPTSDITRLSGEENWTLTVRFYDYANTLYTPASGTWSWSADRWVNASGATLYFPSYFRPRVEASLYPVSENETIETDQSTAANLLNQDILVEVQDNYYITPAHIPTIELRHKHSMVDFILDGANPDDIAALTVTAGGLTYQPYQVAAIPNEYLVILPEGTSDPVVNLVTNEGARYQSTVDITGSARNHCYCVRLTGLELLLSSVTVINWTTGTALSGQYTTPSSYPTFRGAPEATATLTYDNGLTQDITFNERGEATAKPLGRTIVAINRLALATPIILDKMYVDLTEYI